MTQKHSFSLISVASEYGSLLMEPAVKRISRCETSVGDVKVQNRHEDRIVFAVIAKYAFTPAAL